jgi:hypothetical protein
MDTPVVGVVFVHQRVKGAGVDQNVRACQEIT